MGKVRTFFFSLNAVHFLPTPAILILIRNLFTLHFLVTDQQALELDILQAGGYVIDVANDADIPSDDGMLLASSSSSPYGDTPDAQGCCDQSRCVQRCSNRGRRCIVYVLSILVLLAGIGATSACAAVISTAFASPKLHYTSVTLGVLIMVDSLVGFIGGCTSHTDVMYGFFGASMVLWCFGTVLAIIGLNESSTNILANVNKWWEEGANLYERQNKWGNKLTNLLAVCHNNITVASVAILVSVTVVVGFFILIPTFRWSFL